MRLYLGLVVCVLSSGCKTIDHQGRGDGEIGDPMMPIGDGDGDGEATPDGGQLPDGPGAADTDPPWPDDEPLPAAFDYPPWLTMPVPGHVVVSWKTVAASTGFVHFGTTPELGTTLSTGEASVMHKVDLGPLPPATAFYYEVEIEGDGARRRGVFVTPGMERWRFIQFGEFHAPEHVDDVARFTDTIREFRPHLVVDSGDMVDDGTLVTDWQSYMRASAPWISNVIILPTHSNHVNGTGGNAMLRSIFRLPNNERWYPTRFGQVQFLTVESTYGVNPDVATTQLDWLASETAAAHDGVDDPTFVVASWHYPACSSHFPERAEQRSWVMDNLVDTMLANGGVDLILVGHDKYYERSLIDGEIVHVQTNAGARGYKGEGGDHPRCTPQSTDLQTWSLALLEASGSSLSGKVVNDAGEVIDGFTIE